MQESKSINEMVIHKSQCQHLMNKLDSAKSEQSVQAPAPRESRPSILNKSSGPERCKTGSTSREPKETINIVSMSPNKTKKKRTSAVIN